eukprot:11205804-Lingulodinium_polyedra.AAC.1
MAFLFLHAALPRAPLGHGNHRAYAHGGAAARLVPPPHALHHELFLQEDMGCLHALHAQRRGELLPLPSFLQARFGD